MKIGEIKIQTLRLMFAAGSVGLYADDLSQLCAVEEYEPYMTMMTGAINRCFADIENRRILPIRSLSLPSIASDNVFLRYDLSSLVDDYFDIDRVVYADTDGNYEACAAYRTEGDVVVLDKARGTYTVLYRPRLKRISVEDKDSDELDIPDNIAELIPYYLKGELYRDDEPNEAGEAMNWYEQGMARVRSTGGRQNRVCDSYVSEAW